MSNDDDNKSLEEFIKNSLSYIANSRIQQTRLNSSSTSFSSLFDISDIIIDNYDCLSSLNDNNNFSLEIFANINGKEILVEIWNLTKISPAIKLNDKIRKSLSILSRSIKCITRILPSFKIGENLDYRFYQKMKKGNFTYKPKEIRITSNNYVSLTVFYLTRDQIEEIKKTLNSPIQRKRTKRIMSVTNEREINECLSNRNRFYSDSGSEFEIIDKDSLSEEIGFSCLKTMKTKKCSENDELRKTNYQTFDSNSSHSEDDEFELDISIVESETDLVKQKFTKLKNELNSINKSDIYTINVYNLYKFFSSK